MEEWERLKNAGEPWVDAWWAWADSNKIPEEERQPAPPADYIAPEGFDPGDPVGLGGPEGEGWDPAAPSFGGPGVDEPIMDLPILAPPDPDPYPAPDPPVHTGFVEPGAGGGGNGGRYYGPAYQYDYQERSQMSAPAVGAGVALACIAMLVLGQKSR